MQSLDYLKTEILDLLCMHVIQNLSQKKYDGVEKSEQKFEESIGKRVKWRRQKSDELNKMITEKDEIISKDLFKKYFQFQSLSICKKIV